MSTKTTIVARVAQGGELDTVLINFGSLCVER